MPSKPPADNSRIVYIAGSLVVVLLLGFSIARIVRKAPGASEADPVATASPAAPAPAPTTGDQAGQEAAALPPMTSARPAAAGAPPAEEREPLAAEVAHVPRSTPEQLLAMIEKKDVTIIDVRDKDSYLARHIPGALHIPLAYIQGEVPYLPKGKPIVTYCT